MNRISVACSLTSSAAERQLDEWSQLVARCDQVAVVDSGVRVRVPSSLTVAAHELIAREARCCAFLSFAMDELADGGLEVTISSNDPAGVSVARLLAGMPS